MKYFVLDTNVLLHNAESIHSFADNTVVLPMTVIEELDRFKTHNDELGRNARRVIRDLDALRAKGSLADGVAMDSGGVLMVNPETALRTEAGIDLAMPDNRILAVAHNLLTGGNRVIFVSKDINARIKADALGLSVMDFEKQKVNFEDLYTGHRKLTVSADVITRFSKAPEVTLADEELIRNQYVVLVDEANEKHTMLGRALDERTVVHLQPNTETVWHVRARSAEQRMAFDLLLDPAVELVTLIGQAGTGKTLLALAAALECTVKLARYEKILVSRPVVPLGRDIGYLPGTKDEKLALWMQPIFDNLAYLFRGGKKQEEGTVSMKIDRLIRNHSLELEALTYIRGRSIPNQFIIVDEAQNLTPHEVKTIISRAGEGTKMVLTGDPYQIDNPYLDSSSNGLSYTVEKMKGLPIFGHITLTKSERSVLAAAAADHL